MRFWLLRQNHTCNKRMMIACIFGCSVDIIHASKDDGCRRFPMLRQYHTRNKRMMIAYVFGCCVNITHAIKR